LVIRADRTWGVIEFVPELEQMTQIVGGWLQMVSTPTGASIYLDEEGKHKGRPINAWARGFARRLNWRGADDDLFVGDVLFLGPADREGDDTPVPEYVLIQWAKYRADHGIPDTADSKERP